MSKLANVLGGIQQTLALISQSKSTARTWEKVTGLTTPELLWPGDSSGTQEKLLLGVSLIIFSLDDIGLVKLEDMVKEAKELKTLASQAPKLASPPKSLDKT